MLKPHSLSASVVLPARERILRAAQDLFYRQGVRATGVDRIIAEAGVTKVTFYRHFPSKDDLILAFLHQRHEEWIRWFTTRLAASQESQSVAKRKTQPLIPLLQVAREWFGASNFRGCAFANTVSEVGQSIPTITEIAQHHKKEVHDAISSLLPLGAANSDIAWAATLAFDGAIVNAQFGESSKEIALRVLQHLLKVLDQSVA
jgi:AcrR family transcriptional regulator